MIQIRRGKTASWRKPSKPLAAGQPGYDKDKHKIKIGDGISHWATLPYASGLRADEILNSETVAKARYIADSEDKTIITYGTDFPNKDNVGEVYLQHYDTEPETDYIVEYGSDYMWTYQKWYSGIAKCWGTFKITTEIQSAFNGNALYYNNAIKNIPYPFTFINVPSETVTLQSPGFITWLAGRSSNGTTQSAAYSIISPDKQNSTTYTVSIQVEGFWR